jgi:hypothetical protein
MKTFYRLRVYDPSIGRAFCKEYDNKEDAISSWKYLSQLHNAIIEEFQEADDYELGSSMLGGLM